MRNQYVIEQIRNTWNYQRTVANDFLNCIPLEKWNYSPHEKMGNISKQFRHMVWVYGAYIEAIKTRVMDLSKKKSFFDGPLEVDSIKDALLELDKKFEKTLMKLESEDLDEFKVDFYGQNMGLIEFSHVMVQHECIHMGMWYSYASFSGFSTPKSWQEDWGL